MLSLSSSLFPSPSFLSFHPLLRFQHPPLHFISHPMSPLLFLFPLLFLLRPCSAQASGSTISQTCNASVGILYTLTSIVKTYPYLSDPSEQPYAFTASLNIFNAGKEDLEGWNIFIGYVNREIIVDAGGALSADGSPFPVNASQGITLTSSTILKTGIETANDLQQMGVSLVITGTEFGKQNSSLPTNITLVDPNYACSTPLSSVDAGTIQTCCTKINSTITLSQNSYLPRYKGDVTISYDVLKASSEKYSAQVTMSNDNPTGRLDYWNLQWDWQYGEFIYSMRGATTTAQDQNTCIFGLAGKAYGSGTDFSQVTSCQSRPTIIDLDQYKANDSTVGQLEYCCKNGTLLPALQNPSKSKSVFQLEVFKLPPQNVNSTLIYPPINWKLNGTFNADYVCGQPRLVEPSVFPDPGNAQRSESAVLSWQVTCNVTAKPSTPKCCVSFSAYNNDSVVPCKTCACGCTPKPSTCNVSAEALLIPVELATVPTVNRTEKTLSWYQLNRWDIPGVLPCPDNCGVSINWHLVSDYTNGWSARMTVFNWQGLQFADWSAAVELSSVVYPGFQQAYSFNYSALGNNTIFMYGLSGLNYLNGIYDNYPGIQQSVLSFSLNGNVTTRNYYPTKVFFDGNECTLPDILPVSGAESILPRTISLVALLLLGFYWFL